MRKASLLLAVLLSLVSLSARGVRVTIKTATELREVHHPEKVIMRIPAGATFEALAAVPHWVLGVYTDGAGARRGWISDEAVLNPHKLAYLRERVRREMGAARQSVAGAGTLAGADRKAPPPETIDQMLALPDEKIDIGLGALLLGKQYDPSLDVEKYVARLDAMALELRSRIGGETDPQRIIAIVNCYIYAERGYAPVKKDEVATGDRFLHVLLQRRRGQCSSLSSLYLALGERLGLPLFGVAASETHVFVRYADKTARINIETTDSGSSQSDLLYMTAKHPPNTPAGRSFCMRSLGRKQFLGLLMSNLGVALDEKGRVQQALGACRKAVAINPSDAGAWTNLGRAYYEQGKSEEAVGACRKALAINPNLAEAWTNLGIAYRQQGRLQDAVAACRKALAINPNLAGAWTNLGNAYDDQGKLNEAVTAYLRALAINPKDADAWSNVGNAYREQGKQEEAVAACRKALAINPKLAEAWSNLGNAYHDQGKLNEAVAAYLRALAIDPNYAEAWSNLGVTWDEQGKLNEAVAAHRKALAINPDYAEAWYNLGLAYQKQGKLEQAVAAYRRALAINPNHAKAWSNLGVAYRKQGRAGHATEAFTKALAIEPNHAQAWLGLAVVHLMEGDYSLAWKCVHKCQELGFNVPPAFLQALRAQMKEPRE